VLHLKHPYHLHGRQPCNRRLNRQIGTPRTKFPSVGGPLPRVGGGFGSSMTSQRRIWIIYDKSEEDLDRLLQVGGGFGLSMISRRRIWITCYKSEEDLDRLLQVGEGLASIHRRAPIPVDYSDHINNAIPLSISHRGLMVSDLGTRDYPRGTLLLGYVMGHGPHPTSIVTTRNAVGCLVQ
jgi:hypothetical protein